GRKSVELRRRRVQIVPGTPIILYESSPTMAVVGTAKVCSVYVSTPSDVWEEYCASTGLSREEFDDYFEGAVIACALLLTAARRLRDRIDLDRLRVESGFSPPQSYRFLSARDLSCLHDIVSRSVTTPRGRR